MKICKLKLKNLNSFREEIEIDFENPPLDDASLVAITGPTGSGKTTLLDAICVALYGKTPRLSGTTNQHPRHLISHGETEGFAEVHFEANNTRYHATWSIKRDNSRKRQLFDGSGKLITTRVPQEVESILGLDFGAFRRSVMLAQGEFAAFLKANKEDRRNILEATAGVYIYDVLRDELNRKVGEVEAAYDEIIDRLKGIPEASREQLADAEGELDRLHTGADALAKKSQQIQGQKERESKRKEDFEKLQSSEKRRKELSAQQPEIDALRSELKNANRAQRLLPEKQAFDTAQLAFEESEEALCVATTEKTEAETQVETDQAAYNEKAAVFEAISIERDQKMPVYTAAKSDVERAAERFAEADKRTPELSEVNNQIDALEDQLTDRQTQQMDLQKQVDDTQRFLEDNPLPSDRQQRLTRTTRLLDQLKSQEKQLETELTNKTKVEKNVSSLKQEIKKLSNAQQKRLSEKTEAETMLEEATTQLNKLLATGTHEEWTNRKQQAARAYPVVQGYENIMKDIKDISERLDELRGTLSVLNAELGQIQAELQEQIQMCGYAAKAVERCEEALRSEMLTNPINQLRQHLHTGEPCLVCGATEHPYAGVVEPENGIRLQDAKDALENAKAEAQVAQDQMQALKTTQAQTERDRRNIFNRVEELAEEAETLQDKKEALDRQWEEVSADLSIAFDSMYEDEQVVNISLDWILEQMSAAETVITALGEAEQERTEALHAYEMVSQQLENCENNIANEKKSLRETEEQLQNASDTLEDLKADIKSIETRFWELLPDSFHGVTPKKAVDQFDSKIKEVAAREDELRKAETDLRVLDVNIKADQGTLQNLKGNRETLKNEKDEYLREREASLFAAREKTGGLETEDDINEAIGALEADLEKKENARNDAELQLQNSQNLLTQKQASHEFCENQFNMSVEKLNASRKVYFNKLKDAGFGTAETHHNAFRDDDQIQDLTVRIDTHEDELQRLMLEITELQTRFEETPYEPEALERIETLLGTVEKRLQGNQKEIGAQEEIIKGLKIALEKRKVLAAELDKAEQEMERWQRLKEVIPASTLRDFALEIVFRQMGNLANEQLRFFTSERYQLKVETIGDLSVIDRWNANEERPVETLSGGESFLTSLALALALSELSRGRAQLNSLFLDEGFGTLDAETLDTAIAALEGLRMQGRNIFLISHIQELTRRLPVKINVRKRGDDGTYSSSIDIRG